MSDDAPSVEKVYHVPQCSFYECTEKSQTLVRYHDEETGDRWVMEYCGPHAGFVVSHYPNNPKTLGSTAMHQHLRAFQKAVEQEEVPL